MMARHFSTQPHSGARVRKIVAATAALSQLLLLWPAQAQVVPGATEYQADAKSLALISLAPVRIRLSSQ